MTSGAPAEAATARISGVAASTNDTLPKLLRHNARQHGSDVAQREKDHGLWRAYTWNDVNETAKLWAIGFASLSVGVDDTIAIISDSRPDWVTAAVGTHAVRAKTLGLYQDALDDEVGYLLKFAEAKVVVCENEEQVDKILRVAADIPSISAVIYCETRGMRKYKDPRLMSKVALFERARAIAQAEPGLYDALVDATRAEDIAVLCSTSGTTSHPKLVSLAGGAFVRHVGNYARLLGIGPDDEYVSLLPMGWVGEQFVGLFQPIICRNKINFVEHPSTAMSDLREIAPTFMFLAPRVWEQIAADVRAQMMDASAFKQRVFRFGMKRAVKAVEKGRSSGFARRMVMRALSDRLGFRRLRFAATGGAAMGPDTFKFFMALGVPMLQLYGQTELGGIYATQRHGDRDFDGVGQGLGPEYDIRIDGADKNGVGEIVSRHPYMFTGYYKNEAATQSDLRDGWMYTGDAGYFKPSGQLVVIDRMKDLAVTVAGERFSPQYVENKLKFSPYVSEAVILGDKRDYPTALICIRFAIVSKWAEQQRMSFTTYSDLSGRPEVYALISREIEQINAALPPAQRLRKFALLYKELDADDGELTRTRKVRRGVIAEKYGVIIDALYSEAREVKIDTEIAFQDGSRQRIRTTMPITWLDSAGLDRATTAKVGT
jgi:long-chain acyl-CoA synthetase